MNHSRPHTRGSHICEVDPGERAEAHLFTLPGCMACFTARRLLRRRGIAFDEVRGEAFPVAVIRRRFTLLRRRYDLRVVDAEERVLQTAQADAAEPTASIAVGLRGEFRG